MNNFDDKLSARCDFSKAAPEKICASGAARSRMNTLFYRAKNKFAHGGADWKPGAILPEWSGQGGADTAPGKTKVRAKKFPGKFVPKIFPGRKPPAHAGDNCPHWTIFLNSHDHHYSSSTTPTR